MSGDFDREAEKEKLRRQFEREEEARKATEHMSDLLLKGATMTNKHCGECGDPIFRHQGREFCPTCGNEPNAASTGQEAGRTAGSGTDADRAELPRGEEADRATGADAERGVADIDAEVPGTDDDGETAPQPGSAAAESAGSGTPRGQPSQSAGTPHPETSHSPESPSPASRTPRQGEADLAEARASLVRTLTALAHEAESAGDPRRARDLLSAAREAAETLSVLDSVGR